MTSRNAKINAELDAAELVDETPVGREILPVVAIVGRVNVGKSTLYNAMTKTRDAIVSDMPGVTRDRQYGVCRNGYRHFVVVDTGGLGEPDTELAEYVGKQARVAVEEADVVVFLVDARAGMLPDDFELARELRRAKKPVLLVANKTDGIDPNRVQAEISELGLPEFYQIAAAHNRGVTDLTDEIIAHLPEQFIDANATEDGEKIRVAIVGRPNVGKSTLVNRLLGEDRVLAYDRPGTTRDSIEVEVTRDGQSFTLIDTAGIRRRPKVSEAVEKFSVIKALQSIEHANVAIVMIDAQQGVSEQDNAIIGHVLDAGRALILALNKWDGLERHERTAVESELDRRLDYVPWAIKVPISALHGSGLGELTKAMKRAHRSATKVFSASDLTESINKAFDAYQPPLVNGRTAKLRYSHQGGRNPPRIVIHGNRLSTLPEAYKRYLENFIRDRYKLIGTPIRLELRDGANPFEGKKNTLTDRQVQKKRRLMRFAKH
jgi:GTPase